MPAQTIEPPPSPTVLGWVGEHPVLTTILLIFVIHMITEIIKAMNRREIKIEPIEIKHTHIVKRVD